MGGGVVGGGLGGAGINFSIATRALWCLWANVNV